MAAGRGDHTVLRVLLEQGADKESLTADGLSALHCAAAQGALSCVRLLLEANADPHARSAGMGKRTLLHAAAVRGHPEIIVELLRHGVRVDAGDAECTTALHIAATVGDCEVARRLLDGGADVNVRNLKGDTPLHLACISLQHRLVTLLLQDGADDDAVNSDRKTPADMLRGGGAAGEERGRGNPTLAQKILWTLARAPADRAWRRRKFMVIMRNRLFRQSEVREAGNGEVAVVAGSGAALATTDTPVGGYCQREAGGDGAGGDFGNVTYEPCLWVSRAVLIIEEGIFRNIVGYI